jgi:predicted MFS family arabinose efflux permease
MDAGDLGAVLAHQGGWDELLIVAGPLLIMAVLLWVANRRVHRQLEERAGDEPPAP